MGRPSIEYLNARRGISRGAIPADRKVNAAANRERDNALDAIDRAHDCVIAQFAEFRSWFANRPTMAELIEGEDLTF